MSDQLYKVIEDQNKVTAFKGLGKESKGIDEDAANSWCEQANARAEKLGIKTRYEVEAI